ncbi:MAG: hypothetical protein Q4B80_03175 [Aerococcaceae bacterium]|nr:hypothetical protein [Aerococcaceae bacterium]
MGKFDFLETNFGLQKRVANSIYTGKWRGFNTVVELYPDSHLFRVVIGASSSSASSDRLSAFLEELKEEKLVTAAIYEPFTLKISGKIPTMSATFEAALESISDKFYRYFSSEGYQTGDFITGEDDGTVKLTVHNKEWGYYSQATYQKIAGALEDNKIIQAQKTENIPLGMIGALLGALVGGALWVVIGHFGYYAWVAGFIAIALGFEGYKRFGGKVSKVGAALVFIIVIAVLFGASIVEWAWLFFDAYKEANPDLTFMTVLMDMPEILWNDPDIRPEFLKDIAIGLGVVFVFGIFSVSSSYKESKGQYELTRFD